MKKGKMWKAGAAGMMAAGTGAVLMMASRKRDGCTGLRTAIPPVKIKGQREKIRGFIIPKAIMRHLPVLKNLRE